MTDESGIHLFIPHISRIPRLGVYFLGVDNVGVRREMSKGVGDGRKAVSGLARPKSVKGPV
jgi:hypothetical protein